MPPYPSPDESLALLHQSGWSVGEAAVATAGGIAWLVTGQNGENGIEARAESQDEAWWQACEQARAVGMLGQANRTGDPGTDRA